MTKETTRQQIGVIGVDAGLCWIGDPCYVLHATPEKSIGKDWGDFCDILWKKRNETDNECVQFNYDAGHAGLGVCVPSGYGDGVYPVYATFRDGIVTSVSVVFDDGSDEDEAEEGDDE